MKFRTVKIWETSYKELRGLSGRTLKSMASLFEEAINYLKNKYSKS